jgi:hypothetical protein
MTLESLMALYFVNECFALIAVFNFEKMLIIDCYFMVLDFDSFFLSIFISCLTLKSLSFLHN